MLSVEAEGRLILGLGHDGERAAHPGLRIGAGKGIDEEKRARAGESLVAGQTPDQRRRQARVSDTKL